MPVELSFKNNSIEIFKYAAFSYVWSNPNIATYPAMRSTKTNLASATLVDTSSNVTFYSSKYTGSTGTETVVVSLLDVCGNVGAVSSNVVSIKPGRFVDTSGIGMTGKSFVFYKNEAITPVIFDSSINLTFPVISAPTIPSGLSLAYNNNSTSTKLIGTPLVESVNTPYLIIGNGTGTVTSTVNIRIAPERIILSVVGSEIVNMTANVPITPVVVTGTYPSPSNSLAFTFTPLPNGLSYTTTSNSLTLQGTPTIDAARLFVDAGISQYTTNLTATRFSPSVISNSIPFTFAFGETVLFDEPPVVSNVFYTGVVFDPSRNYFIAKTSIGSTALINSMYSPDLRSDLSINFVAAQQRGYLVGNPYPSSASSGTYTIVASNTNDVSQSLAVTINVSNDVVVFDNDTPLQDVCYNFILSRPIDISKNGYYPSNIRFKATAGSSCNITYTHSSLSGTGLTLTDISGGGLLLGGVPDTVTPLSTLSVTATAAYTSTSSTRNIKFAIVDDLITFSNVPASSLAFIQNRSITPVQFSATTLSERSVIIFNGIGLPSGLTMSTTGVLSGVMNSATPGSFTVTGSTGYATQSSNVPYTVTPDSVLLVSPVSTLAMIPSETVGPITIRGIAYSGRTVSNFQFSNLSPTYGMTIGSTSGILNGTLTQSFPPEDILPASSNFQIKAFAGTTNASMNVLLTTINPLAYRSFVSLQNVNVTFGDTDISSTIYYSDNLSNWTPIISAIPNPVTDFNVKYTNPNINDIVYTCYTNGLIRNTTGSFSNISGGSVLRTITTDGSGNWWGVNGLINISNQGGDAGIFTYFTGDLYKSIDNGITWNVIQQIPGLPTEASPSSPLFYPRSLQSDGAFYTNHYYRTLGMTLKYKDGVMMLGGQSAPSYPINPVTGNAKPMLRSSNEGVTWTEPSGGFLAETANFCLDKPGIWVATGSDSYFSYDQGDEGGSDTNTIKYSTDNGLNWSNSLNGFTRFGYEIIFQNNKFVATGVNNILYQAAVKYSDDGITWSNIDLSSNPIVTGGGTPRVPPIGIGPVMFSSNQLNVFVTRLIGTDPDSIYRTELYTNSTMDLTSSANWNAIDLSASFPDVPYTESFADNNSRAFFGFTQNNLIGTASPSNIPSLAFSSTTIGGPTFITPLTIDFLFYQYMTITPITVLAQGAGTIYYFLETADLPIGLSFDPFTGVISGAPTRLGDNSITVYARDDNGTSVIVLNTTTIIPRIIRKQDGAGAYTSLVRQYTEVNAAINARDHLVYPNQEQHLGEFMSPEAPDVTTAAFDIACCKP